MSPDRLHPAPTHQDRLAEMIRQHLRPNPHRPGIAEYVTHPEGVPVWSVAAYYNGTLGIGTRQERISRVSADYRLPVTVVRTVLAYYQQNQEVIDDRINANSQPAKTLV